MRKMTFIKIIIIGCCILANFTIDIPSLYRDCVMSEVLENGSAYLRRQMAYANSLSYHHDGTWHAIGFEPADCIRDSTEAKSEEICHTDYFKYMGTRGIDAPRNGVQMELRNSLHGCPAGASWEVFVLWGKPKFHEPQNIDCIKLLPHFKDVVNNYKKAEKPVEIASILQPTFSALFYDLKFDYGRFTIPNLWPETHFVAPVDSNLLISKQREIESLLLNDSILSILKNIPEQRTYQDSAEDCTEKCTTKVAALITEANFHETEWFKFEEIPAYMEILYRRIHTGMRATLKRDLGGCLAGSSWEGLLVADIENIEDIAGSQKNNLCHEIHVPENKSCIALTPHIQELNTCNSEIWDTELQTMRAQMLSNHRDSVKRYKFLYRDSVRKQEIADSIAAHAKCEICKNDGGDSASCLFCDGLLYQSWSTINIDKYDFRTSLNFWATLGLEDEEGRTKK